ncbi:GNAT family N-acetyltransferase [Agrobacterium sp. Azo12]|uniref:GNAT family N-acetyltransferase n=1 Tax=Agrobacterium sp. Azo12 TaxID=3031129 RepID=UPI0023D88EEB|nr:GNAT family N-acetyltransferase [Agrobacterium sp. Azo12]MDO5897183.1 GNAT family N-acetyltransferase [Agrobacterium sp. Azo12]
MIIDLHVVMSKSTYAHVLPEHYLANELPLEKRELWEKRFAGPNTDQLIFVAMHGQEIAGFCCFVFNEGKEHGTYLHNLYVSQEYQKRGVAKSLLNQAIETFDSDRQKLPVHLLVFAKNTNAVAIYEKLDGTVIEKRDVSRWGNPTVELLRYQWPFADALLQKLNNRQSQTT